MHAQLACTFTKVHKASEQSPCTLAALSFAGELAVDLRAYLEGNVTQQDQHTLSVLFVS